MTLLSEDQVSSQMLYNTDIVVFAEKIVWSIQYELNLAEFSDNSI